MPRQNPILTALQRDLADAIEREKTAKHDVSAIREQLERFGRLVRKKASKAPWKELKAANETVTTP